MNMHRPNFRNCLLMAAALLGVLSVTLAAQRVTAGDPAGSASPATATKAQTPAAGSPPGTPAAVVSLPRSAAMTTATEKAPATLLIERQAAGSDAFLDLSVRAFKPPKRGAVAVVVTLEENKDGGREVELGTFSIFPSKKFEAHKPDEERGFRLNATQALTDLGADKDSAAVKVKVRLAPLHEGQPATGAKLTLSKVEFVPREQQKDDPKEEAK
jgi:hypothetical protein